MRHTVNVRKWSIVWMALFLSVILLSCGWYLSKPAPTRSFTTQELLIGVEDMPAGWRVRDGPKDIRTHITVKESLWIVFEAENTTATYRTTSHRVFQYHNHRQAVLIYQDYVKSAHWGTTPAEWEYESSLTSLYDFTCGPDRESFQLNCKWTGVYEEYIIWFNVWLIPDRITLEDIERIVGVIEKRMAQKLELSFPD